MNLHRERPTEATTNRGWRARVGRARVGRVRVWLAVVALVTGSAAGTAWGDARADYASLFGEEEKKVLATSFTRDDAAFAAKLLARAADLKDAPELQRLVLQRAVELGQKDADGLATAIESAKQVLATAQGAEKLDWRGKLVDLYAAQYKRATGARRAEAGDFLLGILQKEADDLAAEAKYADAVKRLTEARDIARSIRSPKVDDFIASAKEIQARQQTADKYDRLRQKLDQTGGDVAMLEELVIGYLFDVGSVKDGAALAATHPDKSWQAKVELLNNDKPSPEDVLTLARWLKSLSTTAPASQRGVVLSRSVSYYDQFLTVHTKQDAARLAVTGEFEVALRDLERIAPNAEENSRLVIWNQRNGLLADRGTTSINVALFQGSREVWRRDKLAIPWSDKSDVSIALNVFGVRFDRVRIEVTGFRGAGGGLTEVQVFRGRRNVADRAPARSNVPSAGPEYTPERVSDGVVTSAQHGKGYWLLPDVTPGWVELQLPR